MYLEAKLASAHACVIPTIRGSSRHSPHINLSVGIEISHGDGGLSPGYGVVRPKGKIPGSYLPRNRRTYIKETRQNRS
jgi:hypothetical protein